MDPIRLVSEATPRRVKRSFAFIDLCGFCNFADTEGDGAAAEELGRLRQCVRRVAAATSVMVDNWLGDGALLVGDTSEPLVTSVLAIAEAHQETGALPLRAGVASGEVLLLDGDSYLGRPVNLAARLAGQAEPRQVLASSHGLRLPAGVVVVARMRLDVRGFARPVAVAALQPKRSTEGGRAQRALSSTVDGLTQPLKALLGTKSTD